MPFVRTIAPRALSVPLHRSGRLLVLRNGRVPSASASTYSAEKETNMSVVQTAGGTGIEATGGAREIIGAGAVARSAIGRRRRGSPTTAPMASRKVEDAKKAM